VLTKGAALMLCQKQGSIRNDEGAANRNNRKSEMTQKSEIS